MGVVISWAKVALKWVAITLAALIALVALLVSTSEPKKTERYDQENLFKEDTVMHLLSEQLSLIAPGQMIYIIHREEQRSAFPSELKDPHRQDLDRFLDKKYSWDGPDHLKNGIINAYVQQGISVKNNACVINVNPSNLNRSANLSKMSDQDKLVLTLAHEATHCGQAVASAKINEQFRQAIKRAQLDVGEEGSPGFEARSRMVFAESFVGAYFLANAQNPGQSALMDTISATGWQEELKQSRWRGYANAFAAIIKRCEVATRCSAKLDELNAQLIGDPAIMQAVAMDARGLLKAQKFH